MPPAHRGDDAIDDVFAIGGSLLFALADRGLPQSLPLDQLGRPPRGTSRSATPVVSSQRSHHS